MNLRLASAVVAATLVAGGLGAAPAQSATKVVAKGAGWGHGIGMSQYGAYGQAKAGRSAAQILAHYYTGTTLTKGDTARTVRVLLRTSSTAKIKGASSLTGSDRRLVPTTTYVLRTSGGKVELRSASGRRLASATGAMRVNAPAGGAIQVAGSALNGVTTGSYRGAIELRGTYLINELTLEDYVRGVVAGESPASWPAAALQAQAIAARTYAITTAKSSVFDHYPDTRSQVYRGVTGETATTDAAITATAGKFVTYQGKPIATYFFSTSGGQTENVEFSWPGSKSAPYLRSVQDPWDKASPYHSWQVKYSSVKQLQAKLGGWVKGNLRSIDVIKRGVSPRIVRADIVGTKGRTTVTGPQLRTKLGLRDTWVQFIFSSAKTKPLPEPSPGDDADDATPMTPGSSQGGVSASRAGQLAPTGGLTDATTLGVGMAARVIASNHAVASGRVWPQSAGRVVRLQVREGGRWRTQLRARTDAKGRWSRLVPIGTRYRVVALGVAGPVIQAAR